MDKMFARFEGTKSLKKTKNVDVHDDEVKYGNNRDNIDYVKVVDSDGEELFVSEQLDEGEKLYDVIGSMHESSGNLHIVIIMLMEMSLLVFPT